MIVQQEHPIEKVKKAILTSTFVSCVMCTAFKTFLLLIIQLKKVARFCLAKKEYSFHVTPVEI